MLRVVGTDNVFIFVLRKRMAQEKKLFLEKREEHNYSHIIYLSAHCSYCKTEPYYVEERNKKLTAYNIPSDS